MITRITTLVAAVVVTGGILSSVASPAEAKGASLKSGIGISREAKLIRVIRVKLATLKAKRAPLKAVVVETGRTRAESVNTDGNLAATRVPQLRRSAQ